MSVSDECGVVACVSKKEGAGISSVIFNLLQELQNRGQTGCGFATYSKTGNKLLKNFKGVGKVAEVFKTWDKKYFDEVLENYDGEMGIGHVRYATSNVSDDIFLKQEGAQPFLRRHGRPWKRFAIAFNGHLTNYKSLKKDLMDLGYILETNVDTEILMHFFSMSLKSHLVNNVDGLFDSCKEVISRLDGSYNFVFLNAQGDIVATRDKLGFRPLVIGENEDLICVASESKALLRVGIKEFRDILPGETIIIREGKIYSKILEKEIRKAHCHFEYVYFSDSCSVNDKILVNDVRRNLGKILGKEEKLKERFAEGDWLVLPVPSTSIPAAVSYSKETGIEFSFDLMKGEVGRGFINSKLARKQIMDSKYNLIPGRVMGKKVILVDDSIIRGETSERIVKLIRNGGAKEVHFRVTELPIKYPCCYGIDFPSFKELVAGNINGNLEKIEEEVSKKIGADSVHFISFEGLKEALGGGKEKFCFACLDGDYPTKAGKEFLKSKLSEENL